MVQQPLFRGWHSYSHVWKFTTWRCVCRDLLYSSALDYFTVNSLNDNMHHASSRMVEQAAILKLTWLWNPFPRSITWDHWSADHPIGSTSSLLAKGASRPHPSSHGFFLVEISRGSHRGCFVGGSPRPGVFSVFTNDLIDGLKGTLTNAANDTW